MARRRPGTDWTGLCRLIESSLCGEPGFGKNVQVAGRLQANHDGFCHDNYFFTAGGQDLVLRLAKRFRPLRTRAESLKSLPREAETLRRLADVRFSFAVPKLICTVANDAGVPVGLIESCLAGAPLSRFEREIKGRNQWTVPARSHR